MQLEIDRRAIEEILVNPEGLLKIMKKLDVQKVMRPDGFAGLIVRECAEQLVVPI